MITNTDLAILSCESKNELMQTMLKQEQPRCNLVHRFGGGLYIREGTYPANCLIAGAEHIHPHMNVLLKGKVWVSDSGGYPQLLEAPHMFVAKPGAKLVYTVEEVVWQNIYVTDSTDVEYLESILFKKPDICIDYQKQKLLEASTKYEEDRQDFIAAIKEAGWTLEMANKVSQYREDCIPFPEGSYSIASGDSPIHGKGMFATADIKEGQIIAPSRINGKRTPAGYLVNHSKTPNAFTAKDGEDLLLVALRDIKGMDCANLGEEITLNYRHAMKTNNIWIGEKE